MSNSITTLVYKYNSNANVIIIVYAIYFFGFFYLLFQIGTGMAWLGIPLIAFPLYVKVAKNSIINARSIDENKLTISTEGIQYGENNYPAKDIEAIAIYLYSFDNFEYRDGFIGVNGNNGNVYVKAQGDKNTISFRANDEVIDFTFYLANYAQFCIVRRVINDWASEGINVVLKQSFSDDFIIGEMSYYNTPSGL